MGGQEYLEFENHAEATLSLITRCPGDNWNLKLGANIMFVTGDNSKFMASPNITADVEVADKTQLYLGCRRQTLLKQHVRNFTGQSLHQPNDGTASFP